MDEFEKLLNAQRSSLERFVRFRISSAADADDVLQEVYLTACQKFSQLRSRDSFRAWIISIARNKCNDYFRRRAARYEIPVDALQEKALSDSRYGVWEISTVRETLELLGDKEKQILYLYYWKEMPQAEIARRLDIPVGTVKSRLHTARQNFRSRYPYHAGGSKGGCTVKEMPELLPEYRIRPDEREPFAVKCEELMGWFVIPRSGEKISWGIYETPMHTCSHVYEMEVTGRAKIHGIEGVEVSAREAPYSDRKDRIHRRFVAQLTDTHCRYLAAFRDEGDVRNYITFLDGDAFMPIWGFGEDNCGNETGLFPRGDIRREGDVVSSVDREYLLDIVGRYTLTLGGKSYDTVCVMCIESRRSGVISEQFLDRSGRTILWRRFNRDDWAVDRYKKRWSEALADNDRLTVNGELYVHWYDCITDYVL